MKKTAKNKSLLLLILISAIFLIVVSGILTTKKSSTTELGPKEPPQSSSESKFRIFKSSPTLKFTINIPQDYLPEEKFSTVSLNTSNGSIAISKNSTNFNNLDDYIKNLSLLNKVKITKKNDLKINGLDAIIVFIASEKTYLIMVENKVFSLSTKEEKLFSDLDKIAQSFRYTP